MTRPSEHRPATATCGVAIVPGQDDALVLAVNVCIDHLTEHDR